MRTQTRSSNDWSATSGPPARPRRICQPGGLLLRRRIVLRSGQRGFGLVEIMVVVVILLVLMAIILPRYMGGKDAITGKKIASPRQRAQQVQGVSYLGQIAQAITMYKMDHDEQPPASLSELTRYGVTREMLIEPTTGKPYAYNPQTGQIANPYQ